MSTQDAQPVLPPLPEPSLMARDTYTEAEVWGFDGDDMTDYARAALAAQQAFTPDWVAYRQGVADGQRAAEPVPMTWYDGAPPFPQDQEWFIAETTYGDRVVLRSLDEGHQRKGSYAFKTADETYMKQEIVKRWMQFPDCEYLPPATHAPATPQDEPTVSLTGPERVWTCTVVGLAEDLPHGSDASMRAAVYQAFAKMTGDAPAHIFSGWGQAVPERYRAVMENRLPDPEVIRKECTDILSTLPTTPPPVQPQGELSDEREAFESKVKRECGPGAARVWLNTEAYENMRVQDYREGWVWAVEWLASSAVVRDREADRKRYPDLDFQSWLDETITENGEFTAWHALSSVGDAYAGWQVGTKAEAGWHTDEVVKLKRQIDKLESALASRAVQPMSEGQIEVLRFLLGETLIDGCALGDIHPEVPGRFWWRSDLRKAFPGITQPQPKEGGAA